MYQLYPWFSHQKTLPLLVILLYTVLLLAGGQSSSWGIEVTLAQSLSGNSTVGSSLTNITFTRVDIIPTTQVYEGRSSTVFCDGVQCCSSVWGCPNLWGVVRIGNSTIDPNVWGWQDRYQTNPGAIGTGNATMRVENGRVVVDSVWTINSTPLYNVMAYHEVIYGAKPWGN